MNDEGSNVQEDFTKLSTEEKLKHKNWNARASAYDELVKVFSQAEPDDVEFKKFAGRVKDFVQDAHQAAQEKGVDAAWNFVDNVNPALAGKICPELVSGIVAKCILSNRAKTKEKAIEIVMLYFELEKHEATLEELIKGLTNKSPKIVSGCAGVIRNALRVFGSKYVSIKVVLKALPPLLSDRDKNVREEAKLLMTEIYRWIGELIKPHLAALNSVQLGELEVEFAKLKEKGEKAVPEKLVRSQIKAAQVADNADGQAGASGDAAPEEEPEEVKPEDLVDPVEVLKTLPENFSEQLQSKKWTDRKEALELLDTNSNHPKLMEGDYNETVSNLKKVIAKDSNVVVVALAGKCLTNLAKGVKQKFGPCASSAVPVIIEKFKEKKVNVVTVMREAIDACYLSLTLESITESVLEGLAHKTPSVKAETALFLTRCFCKCNPEDLPKKLLKVYVEALLKNIGDPDASVRDSSSEALGTALKVVGEKAMAPFIGTIDDDLKKAKITDYCKNAVITAPRRKAPPAAPAKTEAPPAKAADAKNVKKPVARPTAAKAPAKAAAEVKKPPSEPDDDDTPAITPETPSEQAPRRTVVKAGKAAPAAKGKAAVVEDSGPNIIVQPNAKKQRANDEKLLKTLKWSFQTPTKEFIQQLQDQMMGKDAPCFSSNLLAWFFSADFKNQIKAIQALQEDLNVKREPTIAVIDLILKWFSLRFFDSNPQVLAKGLEYLQLLFAKLSEDPVYQLTDGEVNCFVPYLLLKIGDPKDTVKVGIKNIVQQLCSLTAPTKIYAFLADGMKSKNAKQRSECIDLATWVMETYGMEACVPSPEVAIKLVSQQIGDRDANVRNAALNYLLFAFGLIGDKVLTFTKALDEKDRSMLMERLKRAPKKAAPEVVPQPKPHATVRPNPKASIAARPAQQEDAPQAVDIPDSASDSGASTTSKGSKGTAEATVAPRAIKGEQQQQTISRPATVTIRRTAPTLIPISEADLNAALGEVPIPKRSQSMAAASSSGMTSVFAGLLSNSPGATLQALKKIDDLVSKSVVDPTVSRNLSELYRHLSEVLRKLYTSSMPNYATNFQHIAACYGHVLHILRVLFENPRHADQTNALILSDLIHNLISTILDRRMEAMTGGADIVQTANVITLRIVDNANRTQIVCASVCLLRQLLGSGQMTDKFLDLVIKCVWRCVRKMPDTVLQLQIDPVLLEIHLFLKQFPASHWPTAADDTPFRTVKTILYTLCRMYGSDVLNHLTLVEDPENSELLSFLKRVVKSVDRNGGPGGDRERQQNGETLATNGNAKKHADNLSNIINRLGSSDQEAVQQGLRELYEYREAHDVNLDDLLERTSEDFRKLITEGLRMIEFEQKDLGLPDSGMSEKGQSVINRLKGVISSPFLTAQDIESVKRMADNIKLEIRQGCFKTATQRVEDALRACDAQAYKSEDGATPRPPSILSPSRAMRPLDDNSPAGKPDNLDAIRARVKDYLKNKRN